MTIDINISEITQPVIRETRNSSFIKRFLVNKIEGYFEKKISKMILAVEETILKIEGSHIHLKKFSPESSVKILPSISKAIEILEKRYYLLEDVNFFDNQDFRDKYNYLLKSIYISENIATDISLDNDSPQEEGILKVNSLNETTYLIKSENNRKRLEESISEIKKGKLKLLDI